MPNPISQRDSFWNKIYEIARDDRRVVIVSADMGAPALDQFRLNLPGQFINVGIAEQNGILVASGPVKKVKNRIFIVTVIIIRRSINIHPAFEAQNIGMVPHFRHCTVGHIMVMEIQV